MTTITWLGHAAFKISYENINILIDPFFPAGINEKIIENIDLILVTHDHADHVGDSIKICKKTGAQLGAIVGTASKLQSAGIPENQILNSIGFNMGGTIKYKDIKITMTQAFHTSESGSPCGYILTMPDNTIIYHAGDTCIFDSMKLWGELYNIDIACLPIGDIFTMDAKQAALACKLLNTSSVIPMHFGTFPVLSQSTKQFQNELKNIAPNCKCHELNIGQSLEITKQ